MTSPAGGERIQAVRDRRRLRAAMIGGLVVGAVLSLVLVPAMVPGGGAAVLAGLSWALAGGALVAAGWAALGLALDLVRDRQVGGRRVWATAGLALLAVVAPLFAAAAGAVG